MQLSQQEKQLIEMAYLEDLGQPVCDITTQTLFPHFSTQAATVQVISKHATPIIMCGLPVVQAVLASRSAQCKVEAVANEGAMVSKGDVLLKITGPASDLLMAERILLNFLQRLSGIATLTRQFVDQVSHTNTRILDTRKTLPGFRRLDKYAVQCGGGANHRMGLYDAMMIKDTHIDLLGGLSQALARVPDDLCQRMPVIVEVRSLQELEVVFDQGLAKVSRVLLDNMSPALVHDCVSLCQGRLATEASGNMSLANVAAYAEAGVDFISIGELTHSAGSVDLSMQRDFHHE